jgi:DNA-binding NarL/FixJ family response regulator
VDAVSTTESVRVAVINDFDVIVEGVAAMLRRHPEVLVLDKLVVGQPVTVGPVDVALYDTYGRTAHMVDELAEIGSEDLVRSVALFTNELSSGLIAEAEKAGVRSFIAKSVPADQLVDALRRIAAGEDVLLEPVDGDGSPSADGAAAVDTVLDELDWPGKDEGISERESQVLALVAEGLTNAEIGARLYLGAETVKTYLRQACSKLGFRNRVQAATYVARSPSFARHDPEDR